MDRIYVRDFSRADHSRNVQVTQRELGRPDADRLVGEAHRQRVAVRLAINGDGADAQLLARADDAQGDLSAIGNQDFLEHELQLSASPLLRGNSGSSRLELVPVGRNCTNTKRRGSARLPGTLGLTFSA